MPSPIAATVVAILGLAGTVAIIGGPVVFDMFMDRYDTFWLSEAPHVRVPRGEGCFVGVPQRTPHQVLASHGMKPGAPRMLDAAHEVTVTVGSQFLVFRPLSRASLDPFFGR